MGKRLHNSLIWHMKDSNMIILYNLLKRNKLDTLDTLADVRPKARRASYYLTFGVCLLYFAFLPVRLSYSYEVNPPSFERLADAIYIAEGKTSASRPYGIFYKGCDWSNPAYCRRICLNTIKKRYRLWLVNTTSPSNRDNGSNSYLGAFIAFLGASYAPLKASNDPSGLNQHWIKNVSFHYAKLGGGL